MKKDYTILVVDDEINMCMILSRMLKEAGYTVYSASNGTKAVEIAKRVKPDVALLDLMMPGMSGREVCQAIKLEHPEIKIIYFSAKIESDVEKLKELRGEADTFISKPATTNKILSSVSNVLECS